MSSESRPRQRRKRRENEAQDTISWVGWYSFYHYVVYNYTDAWVKFKRMCYVCFIYFELMLPTFNCTHTYIVCSFVSDLFGNGFSREYFDASFTFTILRNTDSSNYVIWNPFRSYCLQPRLSVAALARMVVRCLLCFLRLFRWTASCDLDDISKTKTKRKKKKGKSLRWHSRPKMCSMF